MASSWRTATSAVDISGASLFQTAYVDATGNIISFSGGDNEVKKYFNATTSEVLYKQIVPPLVFLKEYTRSVWASDDGLVGTAKTISGLSTGYFTSPIRKIGSYYFATAYLSGFNYLYRSSDLLTWTQRTKTNLSYFGGSGNTIVVMSDNLNRIKYSTNAGETFTESDEISFAATPYNITYFLDKVCIIYDEDIGMGTKQAMMKVLSGFTDTTGTNYALGSGEFTYDPFISSDIIVHGSNMYYIHSYFNTHNLVKVTSLSSSQSLLSSSAYDENHSSWKIGISRDGTKIAASHSDRIITNFGLNQSLASSIKSTPWFDNSGAMYVHYYDGSDNRVYKAPTNTFTEHVEGSIVNIDLTGVLLVSR